MSVCLLDVNVLLALARPSHVHHEVTDAWLLGLALKEQGQLATMDRRLLSLLPRSQHRVVELVPLTAT